MNEKRHETTMDVTMLKKRTTTRTRSMGRVAQFGRAAKTETGAQLLLHNRSSEEDAFEGGWYTHEKRQGGP